MAIFINFSPTSSHLHTLQVENGESNYSRLVMGKDDNGKFGLERVNKLTYFFVKIALAIPTSNVEHIKEK